jgi:hypothetical protein
MTLPFRRRHHDDEASHDRARAIVSVGFQEPTDPADEAWLAAHLAGCGECRAEMDAYRADRELLRSLRDLPAEPPRDLWARTAASIEREAGRRDRPALPVVSGRRMGRIPLGVASGVLVVLVVVATSLMPRGGPFAGGPSLPAGSFVAAGTARPDATPLVVAAKTISWVEGGSDGTFQLVFAKVDEVCTGGPEGCAPLADASSMRLTLTGDPQSVVLSPSSEELVVVSGATSTGGGEVTIVQVPGAAPSPLPSLGPGGSPSVGVTPPPETAAPVPTPVTTLGPGETPGPGTSPEPGEPRAILTGVIVVGEAAYSADGQWLAFSARPIDGSAGPDLYLWHVGDPVATAATADHRTFFAGWLGDQILASRVDSVVLPAVTDPPDAQGAAPATPATPAAPAATPKPGRTPKPGGPKEAATPGPTPEPTGAPNPGASPGIDEPLLEDHPVSFLLDPLTAAVTELAGLDIWRPIVSPSSRTIVYWSGTLIPDGTGTGWTEGAGRLVLDGWVNPSAPGPTPDPGATAVASAAPGATSDPLASAEPVLPPGPAGFPVVLAEGPLTAFEARFDPTGTRLAMWVADPVNAELGTLRLLAIDASTGGIRSDVDPLPGVAALRGFSIDRGRLAWVTPPGQDGESSHVHVLAWMGDEFGQLRSIPAEGALVVR